MSETITSSESAPSHDEMVTEAQQILDAVDTALDRLDRHTYGTCEVCGRAIDDAVLVGSPVATQCGAHLSEVRAPRS